MGYKSPKWVRTRLTNHLLSTLPLEVSKKTSKVIVETHLGGLIPWLLWVIAMVTSHWLSGWLNQSPHFIFITKMVFPKG